MAVVALVVAPWALLACALVTAAIGWLAWRKIGGQTGDVLGLCNCSRKPQFGWRWRVFEGPLAGLSVLPALVHDQVIERYPLPPALGCQFGLVV